ncbi:MAG: phosphopentomutase, partial [Acetatifactor sp.]|nr:phosphopentomutase [Acetatifactor sp.]
GFPTEVLEEFSRLTGRGVLCNKPYSGTDVIRDYGEQHLQTGDLIVYTSADSVLQIAAHEDVVPVEQLYEYCRIARKILQGPYGVGRVIARPFIGTCKEDFKRTSKRHDFSLEPPETTMLDQLKDNGYDVISIGKIYDIFAGKGITDYEYTTGNEQGIERTLARMQEDFCGLCFTNLVDYDMLYGHRRDIEGYAKAVAYFDEKLPELLENLREGDLLMITADHGCDPGYTRTTDHTREHTPLLIYGPGISPRNLGTRETFADIGATILHYFDIQPEIAGEDLL